MDEIQKILVQAGCKDLAQEYYKKVALIKSENPEHWRLEKGDKVKYDGQSGKIIKIEYPRAGKDKGPVERVTIELNNKAKTRIETLFLNPEWIDISN